MNKLLALDEPLAAAALFCAASNAKGRRFESDMQQFHKELEEENDSLRQQNDDGKQLPDRFNRFINRAYQKSAE